MKFNYFKQYYKIFKITINNYIKSLSIIYQFKNKRYLVKISKKLNNLHELYINLI